MNSGGFIPEENEHLHGTQRFVPMRFLMVLYDENPGGVAAL
jgi:hypothetical protein